MIEQFETFYAQPKLKAITLSVFLSFLFIIVPLLQRKARSKLTARQKELYDSVAKDILFQTWLLFGSVVVYSLVAILRSDLTFVSGDATPFVSFLGSLAAFWNLRRAVVAIRKASLNSNVHRKINLGIIYRKSISAYASGLVAAIYGLLVLVLVLLAPEVLPSWLWYVNFLMTGLAIRALGWSIASLAAATEFSNNLKLGRFKPSVKREA